MKQAKAPMAIAGQRHAVANEYLTADSRAGAGIEETFWETCHMIRY
ncbi:hypothetical protein ACVWZ4_004987 [Bradyrhizobium sp. USDA 4472]